jgi:hypothetical protein
MPQPRISSRPGSRDVSPRSSFDASRNGAGGSSADGHLTPGGRVGSPLAESPGVPIPGGWPGPDVTRQRSGSAEGLQPPSTSQWSRLPRITTTEEREDGPHSAPTLPPTQLNAIRGVSPNRAASVPDPRHERAPEPIKTSPSITGLATSNGPPVPYYSQKDAHLQFPTPQLPVPPRRSSSHMSSIDKGAISTSPNSTGSHSNGHANLASETTEGRSRSGTERSERSERSGRSRGEPTYCGQCEQVVHGQFVRAMGKVYHLNCFRCKVSHGMIVLTAGLQQSRRAEILSGRGWRRHVPVVRARLLRQAGFDMRKV